MTPELHAWFNWALSYAEQGWKVFPLQPQSKDPYKGTRGKLDASRDPDQFLRWLAAAEEVSEVPNLGIVPPEGHAIIDVDPRDGGEIPEGLPKTLTQRSGGGGWHIVVKTGDTPLRGTMGPGIQIKTHTNGYIVAEPSIHPETGKRYEWDRATDKVAPCPPIILERITRKPRDLSEAPTDGLVGRLNQETIDTMAETLASALHDGQKHATVLAYGGWAAQQGVHEEDTAAIVEKALTLQGSAQDIAAGVDTALWAYEADSKFGWQQLTELLSPEEVSAIESQSPYKVRVKSLAKRMADTWARIADRVTTDPGLDWYGVGRIVPWDSEVRPIESLVDGFPVYRGESNALIGNPSAGKTPTALTLALTVSNGAEWLGRATTKARTVYVTYESPEATFALAKKLAQANGWATDNVSFVEAVPGALTTPDGRNALVEAVLASGAEFLVIETYDSACAGLDTNVAAYGLPMKSLHIPGIAVLVSVHCKKSNVGLPPKLEDMVGSYALGASVKGAIGIHRPVAEDGHLFEITCARARNARFPSTRFRYEDVANGVAFKVEAMPAEPATAEGEKKVTAAQLKRDEERIAMDAVRRWAADTDPGQWYGLSDVVQAAPALVHRETIAWALAQAATDGPPIVKAQKREGVHWYRPTSKTEREAFRPLVRIEV